MEYVSGGGCAKRCPWWTGAGWGVMGCYGWGVMGCYDWGVTGCYEKGSWCLQSPWASQRVVQALSH